MLPWVAMIRMTVKHYPDRIRKAIRNKRLNQTWGEGERKLRFQVFVVVVVVVTVVVISRRGSTLARGMWKQPCRVYDSTERESWRLFPSAVSDGGGGGGAGGGHKPSGVKPG